MNEKCLEHMKVTRGEKNARGLAFPFALILFYLVLWGMRGGEDV